ncbi:hypothetical protein EPO15_10670 [bacterium]|nr:MAG: hypothetical protein EPO15_10670 [bacterium]
MKALCALLLLATSVAASDSGLVELKARGIVAKDAAAWTPEEAALLRRLRRAEQLGALQFIRDRTGSLSGAISEVETGKGYKKPYLTVAGFERWLFILSQEAREYFESKGAEAKFVFTLKDLSGKRLFTDEGALTDDGVDLYLAARARKAVYWRNTDGRPTGTVRPPADGLPPPQPVKPLPAPVSRPDPPKARPGELPPGKDVTPPGASSAPRGPADRAATGVIDGMVKAGALEISEDEAKALAEASGMTQAELLEKTSLQAVPHNGKMRFFLHPSDPLTQKLGLYRKLKGK